MKNENNKKCDFMLLKNDQINCNIKFVLYNYYIQNIDNFDKNKLDKDIDNIINFCLHYKSKKCDNIKIVIDINYDNK